MVIPEKEEGFFVKMNRILSALVAVLLALTAIIPAGLAEEIVVDEPTTIRVLSTVPDSHEEEIEAALAEKYPNITIDWELITWEDLPSKMQQYMQSGMPDVVIAKSQDANNYAEYGVWADLTGKPYIDSVYESALNSTTVDGKILGVPYLGSYGGVYYNRAIFAQYGLEMPTTIDELKNICEVLKANGVTPFATHFLDAWYWGWEVAICVGGELMSNSETWGDEFKEGKRSAADADFQTGLEMMQFIVDNTFEDCFSVEQTTCDARFVKGEAAMQFDMAGVAANYLSLDPTLDFGIFPFPSSQGNGCLNMECSLTFFKSATTEHEAAADALLSVLCSTELASQWSQDDGSASLIKGAVSFDTPAQKDIDYWCEQGRSRDQNMVTGQMPFNEFWAELASDLTDYMNGVIDMNTLIERSNSRSGVCGF